MLSASGSRQNSRGGRGGERQLTQQLFGRDRLEDQRGDSQGLGGGTGGFRDLVREDDHGGRIGREPHPPNHFETVQNGHRQVGDDAVVVPDGEGLQALLAVLQGNRRMSGRMQDVRDPLATAAGRINNEELHQYVLGLRTEDTLRFSVLSRRNAGRKQFVRQPPGPGRLSCGSISVIGKIGKTRLRRALRPTTPARLGRPAGSVPKITAGMRGSPSLFSQKRALVRPVCESRYQSIFGGFFCRFMQHFLNFFPLPQGQGALRPTLGSELTKGLTTSSSSLRAGARKSS